MSKKVEPRFNLLEESWIKVMKKTGAIEEVGLLEFFEHAHDYTRLAGESRAQDFAILRLLLAILYATFGRQSDGRFTHLSGLPDSPRSPEDMIDRWEYLWGAKQFPHAKITNYLEQYRERFWLLHEERPFYQIPEQDPIRNNGTYYGAQKLYGTMAESSNKVRLFSDRANEEKDSLQFPEATRWLIYQIGFDDTAAKPVAKGRPGPGVGWLGKLGLIAASGDTLFETLMLNLVYPSDSTHALWGIEHPVWSTEEAVWSERTPVSIPDNMSEHLTLQSRWIHLQEVNGRITGFYVMGGFFYENDQEFIDEQMTLWANKDRSKLKPGEQMFPPRRHDASRAIWRDLSALLVSEEGRRKAGVVSWLEYLQANGVDLAGKVRFETTSVSYARGSPSNEVRDKFSDGLSFSTSLLVNKNQAWRTRILNEVDETEKLVTSIRRLARDLIVAGGGSGDAPGNSAAKAAEEAYHRLDMPFRTWLSSTEPESEELEAKMKEWEEEARGIILQLGREMATDSGTKALVGRFVKRTETSNPQLYTSPRAHSHFQYSVRNRERGR